MEDKCLKNWGNDFFTKTLKRWNCNHLTETSRSSTEVNTSSGASSDGKGRRKSACKFTAVIRGSRTPNWVGITSSQMYRSILREKMPPSLRALGRHALFQHDNDPEHTSKADVSNLFTPCLEDLALSCVIWVMLLTLLSCYKFNRCYIKHIYSTFWKLFLCSLRYCLKWYFSKGVYSCMNLCHCCHSDDCTRHVNLVAQHDQWPTSPDTLYYFL